MSKNRIKSLITIALALTAAGLIAAAGPRNASADDSLLDLRAVIGDLSYRERTSFTGSLVESESNSAILVLEGYGEHTLPPHLAVGAKVTVGTTRTDREEWTVDGSPSQMNNLLIQKLSLELRLLTGKARNLDKQAWDRTFFVSAGYDLTHFERDRFVVMGVPQNLPEATENFKFFRGGGGIRVDRQGDKWTFEGELSYGRYLYGTVKNSFFPGLTFNTRGDIWGLDLAASRRINQASSLKLGIRNTVMNLKESTPQSGVIFPDSKTVFMAGFLGYVFRY